MERLTQGRQLFNDSETQVYYNRLKEYEDLEEQGLLVKLPCKIGDTAYYVYTHNDKFVIDKGEIYAISFNSEGWFSARYESGLRYDHLQTDIGKMVFLTLTEAEEFIKNMKQED